MARIEDLAESFGRHIATPWQRTVAGAQRVIMVIYDKELERTLRARKLAFETAAREAAHEWHEIDLAESFAQWMASDDYREEYFASPEDLQLKLEAEFHGYLADRVRSALGGADVTENTVVALFGVGSLFGLARISQILRMIEGDIKGRLVVFFPGHFERNNYRLLDARDGWNYLAVPITAHNE
ncbi:BREX protein BrxB domain-containing protein [Rhizobium leguminosarum]|uniref:BREX protein BrxB domain-containing protein n=1 Tax=Rhizobium leguminosarum TaxID=384 RepID=UPI003F9A7489